MPAKRLLALLTLSLLAACAGAGSGSELDVLRVALSPAAQPAAEALSACAAANDLNLAIEQRYPSEQNMDESDLTIQLGEPADSSAYPAPLAQERILLIRSTTSPAADLSLDDIAAIFSGRIVNWSTLDGPDEIINLWITPASDEARRALEAALLSGGSVTGAAHLAASPARMLEAVATDQYALGLLPAAWADGSVQTQDLGLSIPLLALASSEPEGPARALLACLQSEVGQSTLAKTYTLSN